MNIPALTGIRAIAAGIVFFGHMMEPHRSSLPELIFYGWTGVNMFFALSGYLFMWLYADHIRDATFSWSGYLWRRFIRVYPLTLLTIVIAVLSQWGSYSIANILMHVSLLHAWFPAYRDTINSPLWTLTLESNFYLIAPLLIKWFIATRPQVIAAVSVRFISLLAISMMLTAGYVWMLQAVWGLQDNEAWTFTILGRVSDFGAGLLMAAIARVHMPKGKHAGDALVLVGAVLYVLCIQAIIAHGGPKLAGPYVLGTMGFRGLALSAAIIMYGLHAGGLCSRVLSSPLAVLLGECSFALYLIQFLPVGPVPNIGLYFQSMIEYAGISVVPAAFINYAIFNVVALGLYFGYEKPLTKALRKGLLKPQL